MPNRRLFLPTLLAVVDTLEQAQDPQERASFDSFQTFEYAPRYLELEFMD